MGSLGGVGTLRFPSSNSKDWTFNKQTNSLIGHGRGRTQTTNFGHVTLDGGVLFWSLDQISVLFFSSLTKRFLLFWCLNSDSF